MKHERVPGVSHHLNPGFPYHMERGPTVEWGAGGHAPRLLPKPALEVTFPPYANSAGEGAGAEAREENDQAGGRGSEGGKSGSEGCCSSSEGRAPAPES